MPDEQAETRAAGMRRYQADLESLRSSAQRLEEHVQVYRTECSDSQKVGGRVSNCGEILAAIRSRAGEIEQNLDAAEDQARRAFVLPGSVREVRAQSYFGSREWELLQRAARDLPRP
jgi:hypothetical protein